MQGLIEGMGGSVVLFVKNLACFIDVYFERNAYTVDDDWFKHASNTSYHN